MTIGGRALELDEVFSRHPVICAYFFGSQATGRTSALSDVDFAVLLEPDTTSRGRTQAALISDLMLVLGRSDIDVVILNTAPPLLRERAVSQGRVVYCRDELARVRFEVATRREYLETQSLRDRQDRALIERYTSGR